MAVPDERERPFEAPGEEGQELTVDAPIEARRGLYADFALVAHDADSFTLDFYASDAAQPGHAIMQARVKLSHRMAVRLHLALKDNLKLWLPKEVAAREHERQELQTLWQEVGGEDKS